MAIVQRKTRTGAVYQVRLQDSDGRWISGGSFATRHQAESADQRLKVTKRKLRLSSIHMRATVSDYFSIWFDSTKDTRASAGWRERQFQMFRDYVAPIMGDVRLHEVKASHGLAVLQATKQLDRADSTCVHVYNLMHKLFQDAVDLHELLERNPIKKSIKPKVVHTEADFLSIEEIRKLASHVVGKPFELAVWIQLLVGARIGEIQGLLWENVDLTRGVIHIRRTFVRNESRDGTLVFKEYPKGKRWHEVAVPPELLAKLGEARTRATNGYVVTSPSNRVIDYGTYLKALKRYCAEAGLKDIGTHGLRHSTPEVWMAFGASRDDIRAMYAHSSGTVTDRYIHFRTSDQLRSLANRVRLFPESSQKPSQGGVGNKASVENKMGPESQPADPIE